MSNYGKRIAKGRRPMYETAEAEPLGAEFHEGDRGALDPS